MTCSANDTPSPPHYALSLSHSYAQVADRKHGRPRARPFRLGFPRDSG